MDRESVQKTLDLLKRLKGDHVFFDLHAHPFDVVFSPFKYYPVPACKGLFSAVSNRYEPPEIADLKLGATDQTRAGAVNTKLRAKLCLLNARRFYPHTGTRVFADHMDLGGIDRSLLLPVMGLAESGDGQLRAMAKMFNRPKFLFGYCLPNAVPNEKIESEVRRVVDQFKVQALKIHPAITGLDLTHSAGISRVEQMLNASRVCGLKVVIHGGLSPDSRTADAVPFGTAKNLQHIDWSLTPETVVIAHGGFYGHALDECRQTVLPIMAKLFSHYEHLVVDTSGLSFATLCFLLEHFDLKKVLFGSDALYEKQWVSMVKLWQALQKTASNPEEALIHIASMNPARLFGDENSFAPRRKNMMEQVG